MANTKKVIVADQPNPFMVDPCLSITELRRQLSALLGQPWISEATATEGADGTVTFARPAARAKG